MPMAELKESAEKFKVGVEVGGTGVSRFRYVRGNL